MTPAEMTLGERLLIGFLVTLAVIGYSFLMAYLISCLRYFIDWSND